MASELPLHYWSVAQLQDAYAHSAITPEEATQACLQRISELNPVLHAFLLTLSDEAIVQAKQVDPLSAAQHAASICGVPYAIKDNYDIAGVPTTCHSKRRASQLAESDSDVYAALREAGAVLLGKNSMHELATGGPSFDLPWPPALNPWDHNRHPGGSSSGSGVAVATGMAYFALGTDTGGSVRHPATACGIFGFKPSFGAVSAEGVVPLARSLDHPGVLARTAADIASAMAALAVDADQRNGYLALVKARSRSGVSPNSVRSRRELASAASAPRRERPLRDYRIGIIDAFSTHLKPDPDIAAAFDKMLDRLREAGCRITRIQVDSLEHYRTTTRMMIAAEAYAYYGEQIDAHPDDFSGRTVSRIGRGKNVTTQQYVALRDTQRALTLQLNQALSDVDVGMTLSSLHLPCNINDETAVNMTYDQQARTPFNLTGLPAIAVPAGLNKAGLPIGVQFAAAAGRDIRLIEFCMALEAAGLSGFIPPPEERADIAA